MTIEIMIDDTGEILPVSPGMAPLIAHTLGTPMPRAEVLAALSTRAGHGHTRAASLLARMGIIVL